MRLSLTPGSLEITANNPEQEQAEESVPVDYAGDALEVGFNVSYLLDVMGVLTGATVRMSLSDSASSALIEEGEAGGDTDAEALYVYAHAVVSHPDNALLTQLSIQNLRNISEASLELSEGLSVFTGLNGAGKTSVLDAVHILGTGKSFTTSLRQGHT